MFTNKLIPDSFEDVENMLKAIAIFVTIGIVTIFVAFFFLLFYLFSLVIELL